MCEIWNLGLIEYREAWKLQRRLLYQRIEGRIPDLLLLLEHPPTITIGRSGTLDNVLIPEERLAEEGISLFFIDRGGDVTYHGPGQLVGYPIFNLRERGRDIHRYVHNLEEVILRTLKDFSINANRDDLHPGVWVNGEEIAAIGLSVKKWVSMHGFALNVNTDLNHFTFINPCGFSDRRATSMFKLLGYKISMKEVAGHLTSHFCDLFNISMEVYPSGPKVAKEERIYTNPKITISGNLNCPDQHLS
jgi:lipoate-protein ligase B